jgi:hypothetical protein
MQAFYDHKPSILEAVGNGSYNYRWNIVEMEQPAHEEGGEPTTQWKCQEVTVWAPVTSNKITEAVISELWDNNYEQKLVNEYNAAQLGVYDDETARVKIAAYKAFLTERNAVKAQVDADCLALGIR